MHLSDADSKATIRRRVRAQRSAMSTADRAAATEQLTQQLIALTNTTAATSLACYSALPTEPDTTPFLAWAAAQGIEVLLPVSLPDARLDWARYETGAGAASGAGSSRPGRHGISEPGGPRLGEGAAARSELLLIPACAVDPRGTRLGWGMGYYDRFLAGVLAGTATGTPAAPPVYAVVFDADRFPALPRDTHDVPITGAVSPGEITTVPSSTR